MVRLRQMSCKQHTFYICLPCIVFARLKFEVCSVLLLLHYTKHTTNHWPGMLSVLTVCAFPSKWHLFFKCFFCNTFLFENKKQCPFQQALMYTGWQVYRFFAVLMTTEQQGHGTFLARSKASVYSLKIRCLVTKLSHDLQIYNLCG